jgi:hypothetical protein
MKLEEEKVDVYKDSHGNSVQSSESLLGGEHCT